MTSLDALTTQIVAAQRAANTTAWTPAAAASAPVANSPAAATPTGWSSTPAAVSGAVAGAGGLTLEQAIVAALQQQQTAQPQAQTRATVPQATVVPPALAGVSTPAATVAPVAVTPAPVAAAPVAATPVAAGAAAAPTEAPVSSSANLAQTAASVPAAVAGYAAATGRAVANVAGSGVSHARRVGSEVWAGIRNPRSVHVSQVPSKYNETPAAGNKDCGPTSVVMALKLVGKPIPGTAANASPQRLINRVRELSGNTPNTESTTNRELEQALRSAGASTRELTDFGSVKAAVLDGKPVILNGNPGAAGAYGSEFTAKQMTPYDGAHWITVSGFDEASGKFIINDPLSKVGPVKVSADQLDAYRGGSMGIEVSG